MLCPVLPFGISSLAGKVEFGGGYRSTGLTITDAGDIRVDGDLIVVGASALGGSVSIGAGNVTITDAGVITARSNLIVDGTSTLAGSVVIGAGYGQAGVTITDTGSLSMDSNLVVGGTASVINTISTNNNLVVGGTASVTGKHGLEHRSVLRQRQQERSRFATTK